MNQLLLDTDVILDLFLDREPFAADAARLWVAHERNLLTLYVSAITPVNVYYVARKLKDSIAARQAVSEILAALLVCPIDSTVLHVALKSGFTDFEDAVQYASAVAGGIEAIVTRNISDYSLSDLPVYTPQNFLQEFPLLN